MNQAEWDEWEAREVRKRAALAARVEADPQPRPEGLFQFAPGSWSGVDPFSVEENLKAMARYIRESHCERCGGRRRVIGGDFSRGPRWVPCPACRPLSWATEEQARRERPLVEAVERRQSEFELPFTGLLRITGPDGQSVIAQMKDVGTGSSIPPIVFDEFDWIVRRPSWWARLIGWGIAAYYAVTR